MDLWKVCAAFRRPNGIFRNPNSPKGVVTAVLGMSSGETGIWWYAQTRSSLEKNVSSLIYKYKLLEHSTDKHMVLTKGD